MLKRCNLVHCSQLCSVGTTWSIVIKTGWSRTGLVVLILHEAVVGPGDGMQSASSGCYRQTSNMSRTSFVNKFVDHSCVVGALPVGAAPTKSSFPTWLQWIGHRLLQDEFGDLVRLILVVLCYSKCHSLQLQIHYSLSATATRTHTKITVWNGNHW